VRQLALPLPIARRYRARKKAASEFRTHCMVADALVYGAAPGWIWSHFPAGEKRDPKTAGRLKRMGLRPGWPDFLLISPEGGLYCLELKAGKAPLTEHQRAFGKAMLDRGVPYVVARSFADAMTVLETWGAIRLKVMA
jgi:hypothetical protein